ncbi:MAG: kmo [Firmicutes bacterium]|nr:kmo [Bacillota bacterium]
MGREDIMRTVPTDYDAAVVGAGPAGSCAARRLAEAGLKVLLIEQQQSVGENIQCAEYVPSILKKYVSLRDSDVAQTLQGIKTFIQGELVQVTRAPGFTINRGSWENHLADEAVRAGVRLLTGVRVTDAGSRTVTLQNGAGHATVTADYIFGCDGPRSVISLKLGNHPTESCVAMQYEISLAEPLEFAHIYFDPAYYGGYAWVIPKGASANVGIAVHASLNGSLQELLGKFCRDLIAAQVVRDSAVRRTTGGLIPAAGLVDHLAGDHMLLAGDAAGCTHPITGAGIAAAVVSGKLAAEAVLDQKKTGGSSLAENYTRILKEEYGEPLDRARSRFLARERGWTDDRHKFSGLIRRSWVAFPEYYAK